MQNIHDEPNVEMWNKHEVSIVEFSFYLRLQHGAYSFRAQENIWKVIPQAFFLEWEITQNFTLGFTFLILFMFYHENIENKINEDCKIFIS